MVCDWGRGGYVRDVYLSVVSSVLVNTSKADHQRRDEGDRIESPEEVELGNLEVGLNEIG